jgi:hypothetical protein
LRSSCESSKVILVLIVFAFVASTVWQVASCRAEAALLHRDAESVFVYERIVKARRERSLRFAGQPKAAVPTSTSLHVSSL